MQAISTPSGDLEAVRGMLQHGQAVDAFFDDGSTALAKAVSRGSVALIDLLLSSRADPNVSMQKSGETPLHLAVHFERYEIARRLCAAGARKASVVRSPRVLSR